MCKKVETMKPAEIQPGSRRRFNGMPQFPFKDSNGATIRECRRRVPDRRIDRDHAERINDAMFS
jgi:hypothetical protein